MSIRAASSATTTAYTFTKEDPRKKETTKTAGKKESDPPK